MEETDSRLLFITEEELAKCSGHGIMRKNYWWIVHPTKGLIFFRGHRQNLYAQCNFTEKIADTLRINQYPWATLKFIQSVFISDNYASQNNYLPTQT